MLRLAGLAAAAAVLLGTVLDNPDAGTKKKGKTKGSALKKVVGTWTRTEGDAKVTFQMKKRTLRCTLTEGDKSLTAQADYAVSKAGVLFGRITKVENKDFQNPPTEGTLFSFQFRIKNGTMTISDLQSPGGAEARQLIEGDYKGKAMKKKEKKKDDE
jgi:hypothetical protein